MEKAIKWFTDRKGKVTYSMGARNGPGSYDCSSAVYYALIDAGLLPAGTRIGNTDLLFLDLELNGWQQVPLDANGDAATQRGDVFIWGKRGASTGAAGHTGVFVDAANIIHCAYGYNGINVDDHDWLWEYNNQPAYTFYRYVGAAPAPPAVNGISVGSMVKIANTYTVEQRGTVHGITQVSAQPLYVKNFNWEDNGIPVAAIAKVDGDGYHLAGITNPGERFVVPGSFKVADIEADDGATYALLTGVGGYEVWVVIGELELGSRAVPSARPAATQPPQTAPPQTSPPETRPPVTQPPETSPPAVEQPETSPPETPPATAPPETIKPKEDNNMAFSKNQFKQLSIATEQAQALAADVAEADTVKEITNSISKRTKLIVYIVGDGLIGLGLIVPNLAVVLETGSIEQIVALSSMLATAGAFLLMMFGIYKSNK